MTIGEQIRNRRRKLGLTQAALAERVGMAQATICQIERGRHEPIPATARAIAAALGCRYSQRMEALC